MENQVIASSLVFLLLTLSITAELTNTTGADIEDASREPRASGRIVKLYSGSKPDQIVCSGEGFQADPKNCAVFYRCMKSGNGKYKVFRFDCGPGTVFDPDKEVCNYPQNTRRAECGGMLDSLSGQMSVNEIDYNQSELPSPITTSKPVYTVNPMESRPSTTKSSSDANALSTQSTTIIPWSTSQRSPTKSTTYYPQKTTPVAASGTSNSAEYVWGSFISTTKAKEPSVTPSSQSDDECISDGFMGDSKNCRKFYRCVGNQKGGYVKYEFSCSESTIWDDELQSCNHAWAVKRSRCGRSNPNYSFGSMEASVTPQTMTTVKQSTTNKIDKTIQQQTQISYGNKVSQTQTQIANGPVIQNQTQINYGDRLNQAGNSNGKQNQTQISNGSATSQSQTQIDYSSLAVQTQLQIDHSLQASQSQTQIHETTKTTLNVESSTQNNKNNGKECSQSGFMGDKNDCKKFYRCVDNGQGSYTRYEFSCGEGTVWDSKLEACNHAWAVENCSNKPTSESVKNATTSSTASTQKVITTTLSTPSYENPESIINTDDTDDTGYGNQIQQQQTTMYTTTTTQPVPTAQPPTGEKTTCQSNGFIGDKNDCSKFYRCVDNGKGSFTQHEFKCGTGTLWDPDIEACNHASAVKRCSNNVSNNEDFNVSEASTSTSVTPSTSRTTLTQSTVQTTQKNEDYFDTGYGPIVDDIPHSSTSTTHKPQSNGNICSTSGFMGDENDCKKFYRCVDSGNGTFIRYEFTCGEGTVWDSKIEACNHAWAVEKCGSGIVTESQHQETTTESHSTSIIEGTTGQHQTTHKPTYSPTTVVPIATTQVINDDTNSKCKKSGFMGDETDCKKFYRCVDNGDGSYTRYEFSCGEGTVWDPNAEACNHAWAVANCGGTVENINNNQETSSHSPTLSDEEINMEQNNSSDVDRTTQSSTIMSESTASSNSVVCKDNGFLRDPDDCKKFYRCVDNGQGGFIKYEFSCGEGTVWDQSIESCNYPSIVKDCGKNTNQSTPSFVETTSHTSLTTGTEESLQSTESSTKQPQGSINSPNVCTQEGFVGDKNDCKKFYRCVDNQQGGFIVYEFACGEGTVWDPDINACNHMNNDRPVCSQISSTHNIVDASQASTATPTTESDENKPSSSAKPSSSKECIHDGFMGDDQDCRKFYRCVDNGQGGYIRYEFACVDGTVWVQDLLACDHPTPDHVCGSSAEDPQTPLHDEINTTTMKISTTTEGDNESSHQNQTPPPSSFSCNSEGFYGDPQNCKVFYRCVDNGKGGFIKYDFVCGEGTMWNQEQQVCDYESDSKNCSSSHPNTSQVTQTQDNNNIMHTTAASVSQTTTEKQDSQSATNDEICTSQGFFANSNDCSKFYRCVMNEKGGFIKYDFSCGEGTVWVQEIQACDFDNGISSCKKQNGSSAPHTTEEYISSSSSSTSSNTASSSVTTTPQSQPLDDQNDEYPENAQTSSECVSEGFYGDKNDCRRFYRCVDNGQGGYTKYDFVCGDGTAWDSSIQTCNHISEVDSCKGGDFSQGDTHSTTHDEAVTQSTQSSDTTTAFTSSTTDSTNTSNDDKCVEEGYFGNTNDCKKFYRCVDNGKGGFTKYDFTCGEGTIWDQDITTCNHPEDVTNRSCKDKQQENNTSSSSASSSTSQPSTESSNSVSNNCSQEQSSKKPVNDNIKCDSAGYFGDPDDCKKFYRCVDWDGDGKRFSVYHFECGEGTIWDPALDTCNHEESVYPPRDCSGAQSQNENVSENSTTTTTEQTATQQSTTIEETTTQQSTTSEQTTTQQPATTENTTTQQSTTSEPTSTQQSPSSEQTSTQKTTTSQQTTTQQSTTSAQTTTQQSTTSEATTTQQSTTSEPTTTTLQSTTSEQTTTQQSTTSEQTTTEQSTTSDQTTTQESTTSEPTTKQSTTSEQTTTSEPATTSEPTTQESAANQTTTQQATEQTTTEQSSSTSNESSTTEENTTNQTTDSQSASEQTTIESITEQQTSTTTDSSTTEQSTEGNSITETNSSKECPETENDQYLFVCPTSFRRHPKYCNMFYQCNEEDDTHGANIAVFSCPNNTIYDESQTKCVEKEKADKDCEGEMAQRRQRNYANYKEPIVVGTENQGCPGIGYWPFEKDSECSPAFLKCQKNKAGKLRGFVYRCPEGYMYWSISKRCEVADQISDCNRSKTNWSRRWQIPIELMNISKHSKGM